MRSTSATLAIDGCWSMRATQTAMPKPLRTIQGIKTKLLQIVGISVDPVRDLLVVSTYSRLPGGVTGLLIFGRTDQGDVAPQTRHRGTEDRHHAAASDRARSRRPAGFSWPRSTTSTCRRTTSTSRARGSPADVDLPSPWNTGSEGFIGVWNDEGDDGDVAPHSLIKGRSTGIVHPAGVTFNAKDGEVIAPDAVWNGLFTFLKPELFNTHSGGPAMIRRLLTILGRRTMLTFGLVTFLVGALLATVNITSRYALKVYVDDQLKRHPLGSRRLSAGCDQRRSDAAGLRREDAGHDARSEALAFLRARFPEGGEVEAQVDHKPFTTPWLCVLAASDPSILPPALGFALSKNKSNSERGAVLALVGPEYAMGKAFLALQGAKDFTLQVHVADQPHFLFNTPLQSVVRLDRDDLNRWLMDQTGSVSYMPVHRRDPADAVRVGRAHQVRPGGDGVRARRNARRRQHEEAGHIQEAEYAPEMVYVARIDRPNLMSGWDIPGSLARVRAINTRLQHGAVETAPAPKKIFTGQPEHTHDAGEVGDDDAKFGPDQLRRGQHDGGAAGQRMQNIARLIGVVSLLVALPLLWMAWVLAANLAGLLMLNERRTLGLMRLRGISGQLMGRALLDQRDGWRLRRRSARPDCRFGRCRC